VSVIKVLLIVEAARHGCGRHVVQLTKGLLDRGHSVHLLYSPLGADSRFLSGVDQLACRKEFSPFRISMRRGPHPGDFGNYLAIRNYCQLHGEFDVAHSHATKAGWLSRFSRLAPCVVYTRHGGPLLSPSLAWPVSFTLRQIELFLSHRTDALIAVSEEEKRLSVLFGIDSRKLMVVPNGIEQNDEDTPALSRSHMRAQFGLREDDFCIGFVGRLRQEKNPELLIEAFDIVRRRNSAARLVMVGDGPLRESLKSLTAKRGLETRVCWAGEVPGRAAMRAFDLFALTSRNEGMPYTVLEAMAEGLPVVSTPVGGAAELIRGRENGMITSGNTPEEFASAIDFGMGLRSHHEQREAALRIASEFSTERMVESTLAIYRACAAGRER
jgi:glycosyltransferase involved in cell wall biosynthesis